MMMKQPLFDPMNEQSIQTKGQIFGSGDDDDYVVDYDPDDVDDEDYNNKDS